MPGAVLDSAETQGNKGTTPVALRGDSKDKTKQLSHFMNAFVYVTSSQGVSIFVIQNLEDHITEKGAQ